MVVALATAATMAEDGRCAGMPQQLEQEKLDNLYKAYLYWQCGRTSVSCKFFRFTEFYSMAAQNAEFPGDMVSEWAQWPIAFQQLDPKKLNKYDYAQAAWFFNNTSPFVHDGMSQQCANTLEDWWMFASAGQWYKNMAYYLPNDGEPYQEFYTVPVYDDTTFNGMILEMNAVCPWIQARIADDWWAQAHAYTTGRGGFIPDYQVGQQLGDMDFMINYVLNASMGVSNPLVENLFARGFPLTFPQYTDLLTAMVAAQACVVDYFDYTLAVAPPLTVPIADDRAWYNARAPSQCTAEFTEQFYGLTPARAKYLFDVWRADLAALIPPLNASFYANYPTYLGWNKTNIHLNEPLAAMMGVEFLGYPDVEICQTWNEYANGTNFRAIQHQSLQQISDVSSAVWSYSSTVPPMLIKDVPFCGYLTGNAYANGWPGGIDPYEPSSQTQIESQPLDFRNASAPVLIHEMTHIHQQAAAMLSACPQCWARRMSTQIQGFASGINLGLAYGYNAMALFSSAYMVFEGGATFTGHDHAYAQGVYSYFQQLDDKMQLARSRLLGGLLQVGYWAPAGQGWTSDTECAVYRQNHDWSPASSFNSARNSCAGRRVNGPLSSPGLMWYAMGYQMFKDFYIEAKATCGAAFDAPYFISIHYSQGVKNIRTTEMMYRDYIDCGCCKTIFSEFGDCWRTVQPVRNGGGVAYSPALPN